MLTITRAAADVLRKIPLQPSLPSTAGLRIAEHPDDRPGFGVMAAGQPRRADEVVDDDGARVFLGPEAAEHLDESTLDARTDDDGRVEFVVTH